MRFWDTSAVVPLCLPEPRSPAAEALAHDDGDFVVWWGTRVELRSALVRRARERALVVADPHAVARAEAMAAVWTEVDPSEEVRARAERLMAVHPLRSQDALQLAAALVWCDGHGPRGRGFVCLDERLRLAAAREGFDVLPAAPPASPAR